MTMIESYTSPDRVDRQPGINAINIYASPAVLNRASEKAARFFPLSEQYAEAVRQAGRSARRAAANRLVKAAKSPTDPESARRMAKFIARESLGAKPWPRLIETPKPWAKDTETPGTWAVIERRDWPATG